jgi:hypothetical protein
LRCTLLTRRFRLLCGVTSVHPLAGEAPVSLANLLEQFIQLLLVAAVLEEGVEQLRELATPVVV